MSLFQRAARQFGARIFVSGLTLLLAAAPMIGCSVGGEGNGAADSTTSEAKVVKNVSLAERYQACLADKGLKQFAVYTPFKDEKPIFMKMGKAEGSETYFYKIYDLQQGTVSSFLGQEPSYQRNQFTGSFAYNQLSPEERRTMEKLEEVYQIVAKDTSRPKAASKPQTPTTPAP